MHMSDNIHESLKYFRNITSNILANLKELKEKDVKIKQLTDNVAELENSVKTIMNNLRATDNELSVLK
jgi:septal ring factor EnvC (AmiA/AmiB activator)